jgi:hypothetical protein
LKEECMVFLGRARAVREKDRAETEESVPERDGDEPDTVPAA